jgi:OOP family OmpA-OmpF porin
MALLVLISSALDFKITYMKNLLLIIFIAYCTTSQAQFVANNKKVADTYFANKEYYAASVYYKKALNVGNDKDQKVLPYHYSSEQTGKKGAKAKEEYESIVYNLAESNRLFQDHQEAEKWYKIASDFTNPKFKLATYYYAASLRANQNFDLAKTVFQNFIDKNPDHILVSKAKKEILSCDFAIQEMKSSKMVHITRLTLGGNTEGSNYGATANKDNIYFTSSRPVNESLEKSLMVNKFKNQPKISTTANPYINTIYVTKNVGNKDLGIEKINLQLEKGLEVAAPSLSSNGRTLYFTAWSKKNKHAIYKADLIDGKWGKPQILGPEINDKGFNSNQPFVTEDDQYLFFSSDKIGGFGGFDIWYSEIKKDGSLSPAVNLGPIINTTGNERTPYYHPKTKKIIFSTDERVGLGGFDFFESEGDFKNWKEPRNLGYPYNSSKDDLYFIATDDKAINGYISSDRESACCLEVFEVKQEYLVLEGIINDCKTNAPLDSVWVTLSSEYGDHKILTDDDGKYRFELDFIKPVRISIEKDNYFSVRHNYSKDYLMQGDTLFSNNYCLEAFKMNEAIVLENIYFEFNSTELTPSSLTILDKLLRILEDNPNMEIELSAHTDHLGTDVYNQKLSEGRAISCINYLINSGIAEERLIAKGYGESKPIAPNTINGKDNPDGRAKNRRTEFKVLKK